MKNGEKAILVQPVVSGTIVSTRWNDELDIKEHLLSWTDADGEVHERWFPENQLAAAKE